jgi:hypothetical protein
MTAVKKDGGKPRVDLIYPKAILDEGAVMEFGATKYGDWNWAQSVNTDEHEAFVRRCEAALMRHMLAHQSGEYLDPESGLPHMSHVRCNAAFIQYYRDHKRGRPKK